MSVVGQMHQEDLKKQKERKKKEYNALKGLYGMKKPPKGNNFLKNLYR